MYTSLPTTPKDRISQRPFQSSDEESSDEELADDENQYYDSDSEEISSYELRMQNTYFTIGYFDDKIYQLFPYNDNELSNFFDTTKNTTNIDEDKDGKKKEEPSEKPQPPLTEIPGKRPPPPTGEPGVRPPPTGKSEDQQPPPPTGKSEDQQPPLTKKNKKQKKNEGDAPQEKKKKKKLLKHIH